jgi:hypothetical protein
MRIAGGIVQIAAPAPFQKAVAFRTRSADSFALLLHRAGHRRDVLTPCKISTEPNDLLTSRISTDAIDFSVAALVPQRQPDNLEDRW